MGTRIANPVSMCVEPYGFLTVLMDDGKLWSFDPHGSAWYPLSTVPGSLAAWTDSRQAKTEEDVGGDRTLATDLREDR
jgi:hypothetical protein